MRAHQHAAGAPQKKGHQSLSRSRWGLSTKIHAAIDGLDNLARFRLTGGEHHDITGAANLIEGMSNVSSVVAEKTFDGASLLNCIKAMRARAVIPPKANRKESRSHDKQATVSTSGQLTLLRVCLRRYLTRAPIKTKFEPGSFDCHYAALQPDWASGLEVSCPSQYFYIF